ncbi:hypothetical protein [Leifsonia sp. NPDC080035]|uniref:ECF transporter S component n=1 Tax=Leifsonia sp. NPDC080035 TaxID=3143936 RepID=A0AAU7GC98_9MICO
MTAQRTATRTLLLIAAFAAIGAVLMAVVAPFTSVLAAAAPPAYALVAGGHSLLPFLARRLLGVRWAATAVGAFVGVLSVGSTPLGILIVVPLVVSGAAFDGTLLVLGRWRGGEVRGRFGEAVFAVAALVSAVALFLVSIPVMSPEHLAPVVLTLTLAGRAGGQLGASALSAVVARRVLRAGILRAPSGSTHASS